MLTCHEGSLAEARARYGHEPSAPLLLIETTAFDREAVLAEVESLAEVCEPGTNLILLGAANDVETYRALTRRGVADYVVTPTTPARLVDSVLELYSDPSKAPAGQIIAVIGAKGGCGASTLAHNLGHMLSTLGDCDVLIVDLDQPFGCGDLNFNLETPVGIRNVLADPERIDEVFLQRFTVKYGERLHLLAAPAALDSDSAADGTVLETVIEALKHQTRFIILDLPHVWAEWVRIALHLADHVVVVTTPELAGVRNARNLIDFLATHRPLETHPTLVVNRVGALKKGEISVKDVTQTTGAVAAVAIPDDPDSFGAAATNGRMLADIRPRSKATAALRALAATFVKRDSAKPKKDAASSLIALFRRLATKR